MKIIKVIVDELPKSASRCDGVAAYLVIDGIARLMCDLRYDGVEMPEQDFETSRCPDCPLRLEHDNKQVAESVM